MILTEHQTVGLCRCAGNFKQRIAFQRLVALGPGDIEGVENGRVDIDQAYRGVANLAGFYAGACQDHRDLRRLLIEIEFPPYAAPTR